MPIRVVTDSACDLPVELCEEQQITVIPLDVRLGSRPVEEIRELSPDEFWRVAGASPDLPETSAPSPGAFARAYEQLASEGADGIICVTISSKLSATFEAARQAASAVAGTIAVEVVDSYSATLGEGLLVLEAVERAANDVTLSYLAEHLRNAASRIEVLGTLDTLENLRRGGRIGGAAAFIGTLLQVKPVIEVREGVVEAESRQRTRNRSLRYLAEKAATLGSLDRIGVMHAAAPDVADFIAMLNDIPSAHPLVESYIGPVIGAHTGIGTIGVCALRAEGAPAVP